MISFFKRTFNPIWIHGASIKELVLAYTLYPNKNPNLKNKTLSGFIFYVSFVFCFIAYLSHGFFFNYYTGSPTLSKIFSNHTNLPFSIKIFKAMVALGLSEALYVHLYSVFMYFKRREQFERIFRVDSCVDQSLKHKFLKLLEVLLLITSFLTMLFVCKFHLYGMGSSDFTGKVISFVWVILSIPYSRFLTCLLFLLYSYIILIAQIVKQCSFDTVSFCQKFNRDITILDDHSVAIFRSKYIYVMSMIMNTQGFISTISSIGSLSSVPTMALAWLLLIEEPDTLYLQLLKWSFVPIAANFASRTYVFNIYLSNIHSESKKLYSTLNSLIARGKVSVNGKKSLLFILENITGRKNQMAFRDSVGSLVEQMDVLTSILRTIELLLLGLAFKNKTLAY